jgi:sarcosine oxidase
MYTMSDDLHFVVDHDSDRPGLVYAAGLSGHGFKFSSVLGEVLADRVMTGGSPLPAEVFSSRRPSLHERGS